MSDIRKHIENLLLLRERGGADDPMFRVEAYTMICAHLDDLARYFKGELPDADLLDRIHELEQEVANSSSRYSAPFQIGAQLKQVPIRFAPRDAVRNQPTEANPSPLRVIVLSDLEEAQPGVLKGQPHGT